MKLGKQIVLLSLVLLFAGSEVLNVNTVRAWQGTLSDQSNKTNASAGNLNRNQNSNLNKNQTVNQTTKTTLTNSETQETNKQEEIVPEQKPEPPKKKGVAEAEDGWFDFLMKLLFIGSAGLLVLGGIGAGIYFLRRNKNLERESINNGFAQLKKQQKGFAEEIKQLTDVSKNLSQQIAQQKTEISRLKQQFQTVSQTAAPMPPPISAPQRAIEIPRFPVSVDDYLAKVRNNAVPVKYDRKERMLVEDRENEGNLLIVRDESEPGSSLFLVPSFGFFQTKSDYTSYFENYYACARPAGGSVWIRQPAMVRRVNGGWQLAQLGELEVR